MKNPVTPAGIEPATLRFVARHLNHQTSCVVYWNKAVDSHSSLFLLSAKVLCVYSYYINIHWIQNNHWIKHNIFLITVINLEETSVFLLQCPTHRDHTITKQGNDTKGLGGCSPASHRGVSGCNPRSVHRTNSTVTGFYPSISAFFCHSSVTKTEIFCGMVRAIGGTVATGVLTLHSSAINSV